MQNLHQTPLSCRANVRDTRTGCPLFKHTHSVCSVIARNPVSEAINRPSSLNVRFQCISPASEGVSSELTASAEERRSLRKAKQDARRATEPVAVSEEVETRVASVKVAISSILTGPISKKGGAAPAPRPKPKSSIATSSSVAVSTSAAVSSPVAPLLVRRPDSSSLPLPTSQDTHLPAASQSTSAPATTESTTTTDSVEEEEESEDPAPGRKLFARRRLRSSSVTRPTPSAVAAAPPRQSQAASPAVLPSTPTPTPTAPEIIVSAAIPEPSPTPSHAAPVIPSSGAVTQQEKDSMITDLKDSLAELYKEQDGEEQGPSNSQSAASSNSKGIKSTTTSKASRLSPKGRTVRPPGPKSSSSSKYVELRESSSMYQPALTDKDLDEDPEGHRSGFVAVIGRPNAGKSTLINALVGQKLSIVSYKPQTTRHRIMGIASAPEYQMIIFDTPGIIENKRSKLEERMMAAVVSSIQNSEAIIAVVDCMDDPRGALAMFQPGDNWQGPPMAVLLNKTDLVGPIQLANIKEWYKSTCRAEVVFDGSALEKTGVEELKAWAVSKMPEGPTLYPKGIVSEQPERFFVSECIREQIFSHYDQDIPYCTQVVVKEFTERPSVSGAIKSYISALIMVEKDSQKAILIGKGGNMLKSVGSQARREIETFLDRPVYLELQVQVSKGWRDSKDALTKFGYFDANLI